MVSGTGNPGGVLRGTERYSSVPGRLGSRTQPDYVVSVHVVDPPPQPAQAGLRYRPARLYRKRGQFKQLRVDPGSQVGVTLVGVALAGVISRAVIRDEDAVVGPVLIVLQQAKQHRPSLGDNHAGTALR
jgi:hypothetical protein